MDEATRLIPGFYIGSAPSRNAGFSYIVLCAKEYQPNPKIFAPAKVRRIPLSDVEEPLAPPVRHALDLHTRSIAEAWARDHRVLVTCIMGRNRSALVSALALSKIVDCHPREAAVHVRETRIDPLGVPALENTHFWNYLQDYPKQ